MFKYRRVRYFSEPGPENIGEVVKAVIERVGLKDINTVIVAITSGRTGLRFAKALKGKADLIVVSQ